MNWNDVTTWISENRQSLIRIGIMAGVGFPVIRLVGKLIQSGIAKRFSEQSAMLTSKVVIYGGNLILFMMILHELKFPLAPLLGTAGIAGVAVGFASQTSLSNFISGIFLIWEKPFQVGDVLDVGGTVGAVHSIDLLSVKLRMFDNKLVRIPNETLVKGTFTNITKFPIRRFDIDISVAYKEDIQRVTDVLKDIADKNPHSLDEPAPLIILKKFGESGLEFLFGIWFEKNDFLNLRTTIMREIKERFDQEGIEIPFPHRSLYAGSATEAFPIRIVSTMDDGPPTIDPGGFGI